MDRPLPTEESEPLEKTRSKQAGISSRFLFILVMMMIFWGYQDAWCHIDTWCHIRPAQVTGEINLSLSSLSGGMIPQSEAGPDIGFVPASATGSMFQTAAGTDVRSVSPSSAGAMLRSFAVPGWGEYYVDRDSWRRGQYHLAADVILLAAYWNIHRQSRVLGKNMYTHAGAWSGTDLRGRDRTFRLAVGNYNSLAEYNDFQERTRNLNRLFPDTPEYRWEWESEERRLEYRDLRSRRDNLDRQLPALAAMMVVNRVLSGVGAFTRARSAAPANGSQALSMADRPHGTFGSDSTVHLSSQTVQTGIGNNLVSRLSVHVTPGPEWRGYEAHFRFTF